MRNLEKYLSKCINFLSVDKPITIVPVNYGLGYLSSEETIDENFGVALGTSRLDLALALSSMKDYKEVFSKKMDLSYKCIRGADDSTPTRSVLVAYLRCHIDSKEIIEEINNYVRSGGYAIVFIYVRDVIFRDKCCCNDYLDINKLDWSKCQMYDDKFLSMVPNNHTSHNCDKYLYLWCRDKKLGDIPKFEEIRKSAYVGLMCCIAILNKDWLYYLVKDKFDDPLEFFKFMFVLESYIRSSKDPRFTKPFSDMSDPYIIFSLSNRRSLSKDILTPVEICNRKCIIDKEYYIIPNISFNSVTIRRLYIYDIMYVDFKHSYFAYRYTNQGIEIVSYYCMGKPEVERLTPQIKRIILMN